MNRNEKLDYLAGFFDAEGCIGIEKQRNRYQLYVTVGQRVPEVLYLYKALFGGNIRQRKQVKEKWHRLWVWRSPCGRNSQFVKLMSGRLKIKAPGLALAEKFIKTLKTTGGRNKINKTAEDIARCMITEEDTAEREKLHQELKAHNKGKNDADDMPVGISCRAIRWRRCSNDGKNKECSLVCAESHYLILVPRPALCDQRRVRWKRISKFSPRVEGFPLANS